MGEQTGISWTDHTFNIVWGCVEVSPACDNCYARTVATRYGFDIWGKDKDRRTFSAKHWNEPLRWNRLAEAAGVRKKVFCSSMADIFEDHPTVTQEREKLWPLIKATPHLDWQLLTKRHERAIRCLPADWGDGYDNVWMGMTVEDQKHAELRIPYLLKIPARVRWLSVEPMLGRINLRMLRKGPDGLDFDDVLDGLYYRRALDAPAPGGRIDWVVVGGESGGSVARNMQLEWVLDMKIGCARSKVPFFFKQTGERLARELVILDKAGKKPEQWPEPLRVQEFPLLHRATQQQSLGGI